MPHAAHEAQLRDAHAQGRASLRHIQELLGHACPDARGSWFKVSWQSRGLSGGIGHSSRPDERERVDHIGYC